MTVFTQERCFHAFKVRTAELGLLAVARLKIEHRAQQLREVSGFLGVGGIDADML